MCWCFCSAKFLFVVICSAAERTTPSGRARDSKETLIKHFARRYHIAVEPHRVLDAWIRASPLCIYPLPVTGDADGPTTKTRSLEILLERHFLIKMRTVGFFVFALHSSFSANVLTTVSFVEMFRMQVSSATPRLGWSIVCVQCFILFPIRVFYYKTRASFPFDVRKTPRHVASRRTFSRQYNLLNVFISLLC